MHHVRNRCNTKESYRVALGHLVIKNIVCCVYNFFQLLTNVGRSSKYMSIRVSAQSILYYKNLSFFAIRKKDKLYTIEVFFFGPENGSTNKHRHCKH